MADQLLSIEDSTLTAIANAIRSKGGTSAALSFPNGFVSALQAIETEATATPKITPQQVTLTPSNTSFPIDAGFHDGTGTVKIETEAGSANPTTTEVTYTPSAGKFFSSFYVGGAGSGTKVVTGTISVSSSENLEISGLQFHPAGICVVRVQDGTSSVTRLVRSSVINVNGVSSSYPSMGHSDILGYSKAGFSFSSGSATIIHASSYQSTSGARFNGTYFYIVWGS